MRQFRARLPLLAALTLAAHAGIVPAASMALCCGHEEAAASHCDQHPCSEEAAAEACPMHKAATTEPTARMVSCCDMHEQALAALLGVVGIPEPAASSFPALVDFPNPVTAAESLLAETRPPDAPPPRA